MEFKFSNPNFSYEIAVSLFQSEVKFFDLNFIGEVPITVSQPHFQHYKIAFNITISILSSASLTLAY